jgi:hypothetical protein
MGREKGAKMTAQPVKSTPEEPTLAPNIDLWKEHAHSLWDNGVEGNDGIDDEDTLPADCLGRELYAWRYTELLKGAKSQKLVLEVNGGYGTGKTYFLRQWANSINAIYKGANGGKESLGIAIYYSAWDVDFHQGALLPLMTEINESFDAKKSKLLKGYEKGKGALINIIREKANDEIEKVKSSSFQLMGKALDTTMIANGMPPLASGFLRRFKKNLEERGQNTLNSYEEQKDQIYAFKKQLKALSDKLGGITIFVDELERCRPTHAVETLEIIKHLLNVKGIHVVIGTDRSQLKCTIENLYGQNMDGDEYLRRFIDLEMTLPDPDYYGFAEYLAGTVPDEYWLPELSDEDRYQVMYGKQAFIDAFALYSCQLHQIFPKSPDGQVSVFGHVREETRLRHMVKAMNSVKFLLESNVGERPYYPQSLALAVLLQVRSKENMMKLKQMRVEKDFFLEDEKDRRKQTVVKSILQEILKHVESERVFNTQVSFMLSVLRDELLMEIKRKQDGLPVIIDYGIGGEESGENGWGRRYKLDGSIKLLDPNRSKYNGSSYQKISDNSFLLENMQNLSEFCHLKGANTVLQAMIKTIQNGETLAEDSSGKP